jgi:hypothetical protein
MMHAGLVEVLISILKDLSVLEMVAITKGRGLTASPASRPSDVVVLDLFVEGGI